MDKLEIFGDKVPGACRPRPHVTFHVDHSRHYISLLFVVMFVIESSTFFFIIMGDSQPVK